MVVLMFQSPSFVFLVFSVLSETFVYLVLLKSSVVFSFVSVFLLLKLKSEELMLFFTSLTMMLSLSWFGKVGLGKQMI